MHLHGMLHQNTTFQLILFLLRRINRILARPRIIQIRLLGIRRTNLILPVIDSISSAHKRLRSVDLRAARPVKALHFLHLRVFSGPVRGSGGFSAFGFVRAGAGEILSGFYGHGVFAVRNF